MLEFDHIAISAASLSEGADWIENLLGQPLAAGGNHPTMGTHNALLSLGPAEYLEVIAIDADADGPTHPRWFALDRFDGPPRLTNWICRTRDLNAALNASPAGAGRTMALSRGDLRWQMAVPSNGELPFDDCFPALIQWDGPHPAPRLPDHGCRLNCLEIGHPEIERLGAALGGMEDARIRMIRSEASHLRAFIATPAGDRVIG